MGTLWFPFPSPPVSTWKREPEYLGETKGTGAASFPLLTVGLTFGLRHQQQPLGMPRVASPFLFLSFSSVCSFFLETFKISYYILTQVFPFNSRFLGLTAKLRLTENSATPCGQRQLPSLAL